MNMDTYNSSRCSEPRPASPWVSAWLWHHHLFGQRYFPIWHYLILFDYLIWKLWALCIFSPCSKCKTECSFTQSSYMLFFYTLGTFSSPTDLNAFFFFNLVLPSECPQQCKVVRQRWPFLLSTLQQATKVAFSCQLSLNLFCYVRLHDVIWHLHLACLSSLISPGFNWKWVLVPVKKL